MNRCPRTGTRSDRGQRGQIIVIAAIRDDGHHRRGLARPRRRQRLCPPARRAERHRLGRERRGDDPCPATWWRHAGRRRRPRGDGRHVHGERTRHVHGLVHERDRPAARPRRCRRHDHPATRPRGSATAIIPPGAQGVQVGGSQSFDTTFARVLGIHAVHGLGRRDRRHRRADRRRVPAGGLPGEPRRTATDPATRSSPTNRGASAIPTRTRTFRRSARSTSCRCARPGPASSDPRPRPGPRLRGRGQEPAERPVR